MTTEGITQMPAISRGKRWAYGGAIVGGVVSVLANIAHSFVPAQPDGMSDETWRSLANASPQPGAVLLAAFWPSALLLAIEVLARVSWPRQLRWTLVRWAGVTPVAIVAAVVSYRHLSGLLHWYGEDPLTVAIGPMAVDGLMVVSTGALLALAILPAVAQPIEEPIEEPIGDEVPEPNRALSGAAQLARAIVSDGWVGLDGQPTEDPSEACGPVGSDRVVALHSVPDQVDGSAPVAARPKDLAAAQTAIREGRLKHPLTADAIRDELKIGLANARLVRDALPKQQAEG